MGRKKFEYDARVLEYVDSSKEYGNKLSKKDLKWLKNFERSYYANDHNKPNSVFRKELGDGEYLKEQYTNIYDNPISLKQVLTTEYNAKMRDLQSNIRHSKEETIGLGQFEDYQDFVDFSDLKEDRSTISNLLKHYSYQEVFELYIRDVMEKLNEDANQYFTLEYFAYKMMILHGFAKKIHKKEEKKKRDTIKALLDLKNEVENMTEEEIDNEELDIS